MKLYETVFIVRQDATSAQVEALTQDYTKVIRNLGGEVNKTEFCGLRPLAYKIKKNGRGHYVLMNITADYKAIAEMERLMKINESILRFMSVNVEAHDPNPSSLMQQKGFSMDRSRSYDDDQEEPSFRRREKL
jgi:small subunit ribosomal protein S6